MSFSVSAPNFNLTPARIPNHAFEINTFSDLRTTTRTFALYDLTLRLLHEILFSQKRKQEKQKAHMLFEEASYFPAPAFDLTAGAAAAPSPMPNR